MPSWESDGQVGAEILMKSMSSRVYEEYDPRAMATATDELLHHLFAARLLDRSVFK